MIICFCGHALARDWAWQFVAIIKNKVFCGCACVCDLKKKKEKKKKHQLMTFVFVQLAHSASKGAD